MLNRALKLFCLLAFSYLIANCGSGDRYIANSAPQSLQNNISFFSIPFAQIENGSRFNFKKGDTLDVVIPSEAVVEIVSPNLDYELSDQSVQFSFNEPGIHRVKIIKDKRIVLFNIHVN